MDDLDLHEYNQLVRFFDKQTEWLGLPRNTGPVLIALYIAKYKSNEKLGVDDICRVTNYSRSNVGLILAQLEALGLIYSSTDFDQTGRGRRRILYEIDDNDDNSLISLGIKKMTDQLESIVSNIDMLITKHEEDAPFIVKMLEKLKESAMDNHLRLASD